MSDPKVSEAATKIQATYRGHAVRKERHAHDEDPELVDAAVKIQAGFRGHLVRKDAEKARREKEIEVKLKDLSCNPPRKTYNEGITEKKDSTRSNDDYRSWWRYDRDKKLITNGEQVHMIGLVVSGRWEEEEEVDIDLDDPAVGAAAAKIQASFREHMMKKKSPRE
ncbi:unnamed protein product [Darwinula stevensoni]|uniref:Uncharacterized protein n=1 Tax=Darwinula stevensoni TaxID=69355 RepID=A0A7R9A687_9CRUS|nr:unnamed protein product [Darwinula stevensoni]CAG0893705.1 unnamed protein product [Darwinula stevensoni]